MKKYLLISLILLPTLSWAESDVWLELLKVMRFGDTNLAKIEFDCLSNTTYSSTEKLIKLCENRAFIKNSVLEKAALPYLKAHLSKQLAEKAIIQFSSNSSQTITNKIITEISSGKRDQLTQSELNLLKEQNESEVGQALSSFAQDKQQARAVIKAVFESLP